MRVHPMETVPRVRINRVIPGSLAITHAGTHFYSIGLSAHKPLNAPKRRWFHKPIVVFATLFSQLIIRQLVSILIPQQNPEFYAIIGDFTYFFGKVWVNASIGMIVVSTIALFSQLLNFYNFMNGIKPRDLSVFSMLSGLITPISIGIHDKQVVIKLLTFSRKCIKYTEIITNAIFYMSLISIILIFTVGMKSPTYIMVLFASFHCILTAINGYYVNCIITWQLVYYMIIVYYLWLKIQSINHKLIGIKKGKTNINQIMRKLYDILTEIGDYNRIYWQYFLAIYWFLITIFITIALYMTFYIQIFFIINDFVFILFVEFLLTLVFIIHYSATLYNQNKTLYKHFHSYSLQNKVYVSLATKLKVCFIYLTQTLKFLT